MEHLAVPHHHAPIFASDDRSFFGAVHGSYFGKRSRGYLSTSIGGPHVNRAHHAFIPSEPEQRCPVLFHGFGLGGHRLAGG